MLFVIFRKDVGLTPAADLGPGASVLGLPSALQNVSAVLAEELPPSQRAVTREPMKAIVFAQDVLATYVAEDGHQYGLSQRARGSGSLAS